MLSKILVVIALITIGSGNINAQYVTIPDANFVAWLTETYPTCMNGNDLDTTCINIEQETDVQVGSLSISDLTGIQYFNNLTFLDCSSNNLTSLPNLPPSIQGLYCNINQLTALPTLPPTLDLLDCSFNNLTNIPELPSTLTSFACSNNQLDSLPELPSMLIGLYCSFNLLTQLPELPFALNDVNISNNQLTSLPELPQNIQIILCNNNILTSLPNLPQVLQTLDCSDNQLTELPELPATMHVLTCHNNLLVSLPAIPPLVYAILCNNNQLTSLPELPQLQWLQCGNNLITCFPTFPDGIGFSPDNFNISNNPATCLPNYIPAMGAELLAMPLCNISNSNGCEGAASIGVVGKVYRDVNSSCDFDSGDNLQMNIPIKIYNPSVDEHAFTNSSMNGIYNFSQIPGTYVITIDTLNKPFIADCAQPGADTTVTLSTAEPLASNINFNIKCRDGLDLNVQSINHQNGLIFPGQQHTLQVMVGDASQWYGLSCASGTSGQVQIVVDGPVSYNGIAPGALSPVVNGNVYTYTIADFGLINNATDFRLLFTTDTTAQNADQICVSAEVTSAVNDILPMNNLMDYCYSVVNSYDPNYKEVYPVEVLPGFQDWLTYTIHFQNLGTAPAINIRVLDTLDSNLNLETFEVINSSHHFTTTMLNGIVNFRFPNIFLPDSMNNPSGSEAFVQYRIKPNSNLPVGTQLENTAHIFFDYNPAVITNTTVNSYINILSSSSSTDIPKHHVFPNPSHGAFTIDGFTQNENYTVILTDLTGKLIKNSSVKNVKQVQMDTNEVANGIYILTITGDNIRSNHKLIIQK
jgi:uncharacterized repeat protein (TIGR01451 family)